MDEPEFSITPGYGPRNLANLHYSQAVRIGDRVEAAGQGGWDDDGNIPEDLEDEIGERHTRVMVEQLRKRMGDRAPIWTEIGVAALGAPNMHVEIRVTAIVGQGG